MEDKEKNNQAVVEICLNATRGDILVQSVSHSQTKNFVWLKWVRQAFLHPRRPARKIVSDSETSEKFSLYICHLFLMIFSRFFYFIFDDAFANLAEGRAFIKIQHDF